MASPAIDRFLDGGHKSLRGLPDTAYCRAVPGWGCMDDAENEYYEAAADPASFASKSLSAGSAASTYGAFDASLTAAVRLDLRWRCD